VSPTRKRPKRASRADREASVDGLIEAVASDPRPNEKALSRVQLEELRQSGATREDAEIVVRGLFENPEDQRKVMADLSSYGPWAGDPSA
jgi:hypothetical protein